MRVLLLPLLLIYIQSCGAPAKSSADVQSSLDSIDVSLTSKLDAACASILDGVEPSIAGTDIKTGNCQIDESKVADYATHGTMIFHEPETETLFDSGGDKTSIYRRGQLWLSHNLVELGAKAHCVLSKVDQIKDAVKGVNGACDGKNSVSSGGGGESSGGIGDILTGGEGGLVNIDIEPVGEMDVNLAAGVVEGVVNLTITGAADIQATLKYAAGGAGKSIAVVLKTTETAPSTSLLRDLSLAVMIIPHAGDVYVDTMFGAHLANIGVSGVINGIIDTMLGDLIIGILEKVVILDVVDVQAGLVGPRAQKDAMSFSLLPSNTKVYEKKTLLDYVNENLKK